MIKVKVDVYLYVFFINVCIIGNLCIVKMLIKVGVDVNCLNYGVFLFFVVCINGYFNVVKELIIEGVDVNVNLKDEVDWVN